MSWGFDGHAFIPPRNVRTMAYYKNEQGETNLFETITSWTQWFVPLTSMPSDPPAEGRQRLAVEVIESNAYQCWHLNEKYSFSDRNMM
jgi:hypothetical protein